MQKIILTFILSVFSCGAIRAQQAEGQQVLKCVYLEESINRADQPEDVKQDEFVLAVSGQKSAFYSRLKRAQDTMKDSLMRSGASATEVLAKVMALPKGKSIEVYKNQPEAGKFIHCENIAQDFRYEETLPQIDWQMGEETKTILGYNCQKAVGKLYGREWTAWFTMDIPAFDGPWLLTGLPGLILEAVDADNLFHFTAIELGRDASLSVLPVERKSVKCSRKELLAQRRKKDEDPASLLQATLGIKIQQVKDAQGRTLGKDKMSRKTNYYEKE